jgi:hypothetical protein
MSFGASLSLKPEGASSRGLPIFERGSMKITIKDDLNKRNVHKFQTGQFFLNRINSLCLKTGEYTFWDFVSEKECRAMDVPATLDSHIPVSVEEIKVIKG